MNKLSFDYSTDVDASTIHQALSGVYCSRFPLTTLPITPELLTVDGSQWFHAVEAISDITRTHQRVVRIRIITRQHRGVTVTIPVTDAIYVKFRDLRFKIRNSDRVMITFPELKVLGSPFQHELCLRAEDFKIQPPQPTVQI